LIVVCGETLIDLVHVDGEFWRANATAALARLGTSTAMLARISGDAFGGRLRERLADNGIDLRYVMTASEPSTVAVVDLDESGGARYSFYLRETADWQWTVTSLPVDFDDSVTTLHAGSMALFMPPGGVALEAMLTRERAHRVISIDPNVRAAICPDPLRYREVVERWLRVAHIVKASADDVGWLYPDRPLTDVLLDWSQRGPSVVAITLGADGVVARTAGGELVQVPGVPVDVVDTIGAGDTFSAALLHALEALECLDVEKLAGLTAAQLEVALRYAISASAVSCTRAGADPPYGQDLPPVRALFAE